MRSSTLDAIHVEGHGLDKAAYLKRIDGLSGRSEESHFMSNDWTIFISTFVHFIRHCSGSAGRQHIPYTGKITCRCAPRYAIRTPRKHAKNQRVYGRQRLTFVGSWRIVDCLRIGILDLTRATEARLSNPVPFVPFVLYSPVTPHWRVKKSPAS